MSAAEMPAIRAIPMNAMLTNLARGAMRRLSHTAAAAVPAETVGAAIDRCARALQRARVHFGHGTDNARDEAAEMGFFAARIEHAVGSDGYRRPLTARRRERIDELLRRRIEERIPLAYLTHRAFFAGLTFHVDERGLGPRSPFPDLIENHFAPCGRKGRKLRLLDM